MLINAGDESRTVYSVWFPLIVTKSDGAIWVWGAVHKWCQYTSNQGPVGGSDYCWQRLDEGSELWGPKLIGKWAWRSLEMWEGIGDILEHFADNDDVRAVIMRGAGGKAFVSGADISEFDQARANAEQRESWAAWKPGSVKAEQCDV